MFKHRFTIVLVVALTTLALVACAPTPPVTVVVISPTQPVPAATPIAVAQTPLPPGQGQPPVRLQIPAAGLDTPVVAVAWHAEQDLVTRTFFTVWDTAPNAAGHHINSANAGEIGNVVLSGHHNTGSAVFREVSPIGLPGARVNVGDQVLLQGEQGGQFVYVVRSWQRFDEANASEADRQMHAHLMDPTPDATLTLITCYPAWDNTSRVVVTAKLQE